MLSSALQVYMMILDYNMLILRLTDHNDMYIFKRTSIDRLLVNGN